MCFRSLAYPFFTINLNSYRFRLIFYLLKSFVCSDIRIKRVIDYNISILEGISCYKGQCHKLFLPVRGQRTRSNAWTQRNKRKKQK